MKTKKVLQEEEVLIPTMQQKEIILYSVVNNAGKEELYKNKEDAEMREVQLKVKEREECFNLNGDDYVMYYFHNRNELESIFIDFDTKREHENGYHHIYYNHTLSKKDKEKIDEIIFPTNLFFKLKEINDYELDYGTEYHIVDAQDIVLDIKRIINSYNYILDVLRENK